MNRPGAIFIPMLAGFLLTVAVVSWRSGLWPRAPESAAAEPARVAVRRSNLRIVQVHLTTGSAAGSAVTPAHVAAIPATAPPPAQRQPEAAAEPPAPPPVPRANTGNSPDGEAPVRKFARGSSPGAQ